MKKWYGHAVDIWISEYGFETKPAEPRGVSLAAQAAYASQTINKLRGNPYVKMLVWFIFRDDPTSTWQSGLETRDGARKPAFASFSAAAKTVDVRNVTIRAKVNQVPVVRIPVLELAARNGAGAFRRGRQNLWPEQRLLRHEPGTGRDRNGRLGDLQRLPGPTARNVPTTWTSRSTTRTATFSCAPRR